MLKLTAVATLALTIGACVPTTPSYLVSPADPASEVRTPGYASVTAGVKNYDVVDPLDWREQNRRVGPNANPERDDSNDAARRGR